MLFEEDLSENEEDGVKYHEIDRLNISEAV